MLVIEQKSSHQTCFRTNKVTILVSLCVLFSFYGQFIYTYFASSIIEIQIQINLFQNMYPYLVFLFLSIGIIFHSKANTKISTIFNEAK
jgi:hypothetical protein